MTDLNSKLLTEAAIEMMDQIAESRPVGLANGAEAPESVTRSYTYESTNKKGQKVTKQVVRKYTNKKNTTNTLQNKTNKDTVIKLVDKILDQSEIAEALEAHIEQAEVLTDAGISIVVSI